MTKAKEIIQVTTFPFGECGVEPRRLLEKTGLQIRYNPFGRRLKKLEIADVLGDAHGVVAGTEPYFREVIEKAKNLRVIARVGVGLDGIDYEACWAKGIVLTFTPEAPADGVAEMAVAQIINLLRFVGQSDKSVREGAWNRHLGWLVREMKIGILGVGRIGKRVVKLLQPFQPQLFGCDIAPDQKFAKQYNLTWLDKAELFRTCDLVTVHAPLNKRNIDLVDHVAMAGMKPGSFLVNLARGKLVNEEALIDLLEKKHLGGAALDVFEEEPYQGPLTTFPNVMLTAHMGASARHSRFLMEFQAAEDCARVLSGQAPLRPVTKDDIE